ncbi:MAG: dihydrofolate reductase [Spirosomataceae bacterium]|jgi:dihydrofolate reductase
MPSEPLFSDLSMIVAVAENGVIGNDNQLIWRLSNDLKNFKRLTTGNVIIMGRKTFDSIGKPLPNRINIVVTRNEGLEIPGCEVANSIEEALKIALQLKTETQKVFIIGGENIYRQTIDSVSTIYYTKVHASPEGDAFFPELSDGWKETERTSFKSDTKNDFDFDVILYARMNAV